ncbi:MAG: response regulator [Pirellulales bacterium]|nr:response regulator [Pirellulales bacterium]
MPTVLVVDDSVVDLRLVGGVIERETELKVQFAGNGVEALDRMAEGVPDLVLTDLIMPEMDGLELVEAVRSRFPLVPVIVMTSMGNEEVAIQALRAGAASYVPKRLITRDLPEAIQKVLAAATHRRSQSRLMCCIARAEYEFQLENDASLFPPLIAYLQEAVGQMGLSDEVDRMRVGVALEEALVNAMYHGNLEVDSSLKEKSDHAYHALVQERRQQSPYRDRRVCVEARFTRSRASFTIRDEGKGFDPNALPDPTDPANLEKASGRGVLLMRTFMDEITYNDRGNAVTLTKYCGDAAG